MIYAALKDGRVAFYVVQLATGAIEEIPCPYTDIQDLKRVTDNSFVFLDKSAEAPLGGHTVHFGRRYRTTLP